MYTTLKNLEEYKGVYVADIAPIRATVTFNNGDTLAAGEASDNVNANDICRIQIRETINSHFDKEESKLLNAVAVLH